MFLLTMVHTFLNSRHYKYKTSSKNVLSRKSAFYLLLKDRDATSYLSLFFSQKDLFALSKLSPLLKIIFTPFLYKQFSFNWYSKEIKSFINYSCFIEKLEIDTFDFFYYVSTVSLPRLKKITLKYCNLKDIKFLENYSSLEEVYIHKCLIIDQTLNFNLLYNLKSFVVNS